MGAITIERGDIIATKNGETIRVQKVYYNGDALFKIEGVDDSEVSPMMRPFFSNQIARVLKKAVIVPRVECPPEHANDITPVETAEKVPTLTSGAQAKKGGR